MFVQMIRHETLGDLIRDMGNTQDEVDTMKLGLQHTYLGERFDSENIQAKQNKKHRKLASEPVITYIVVGLPYSIFQIPLF